MTRTDRVLMVLTIVGVLTYVATWAVLGVLADGYDPLRQAISELFDLGAPDWQRLTLAGVLLVTGVALLPVGPVFDRLMPGRGRLGPLLAVLAGLGTLTVAFFPCTAGCPRWASSPPAPARRCSGCSRLRVPRWTSRRSSAASRSRQTMSRRGPGRGAS